MAHNIGAMFYFGDIPWHGLGTALPAAATLSEALTHGELRWTVELVPLATAEPVASPVAQRMAVVRTDRGPGTPGRVLGVVHPGFRPLQNEDGARLFDNLLGRGDAIYHTGGYLGSGEVVWLLARVPGGIKVSDRDVLEPYLLFTNSHDGSVGIDIRLTTVRVVCQNTLSLALHSGNRRQVFRRAHRGSHELLALEAKAFFALSQERMRDTEALFRRLAKEPCPGDAFDRFLLQLLPEPRRPATANANPAVRKAWETRTESIAAARAAIGRVRSDGIEERAIPPAGANWWESLNAVTAWVDHRQQTDGDRYAHVLLGSGDKMKTAALELAVQATSSYGR